MTEYGLEWHSLTSYMEMQEVTAPTVVPTNSLRLYAKDSGGAARLFYKSDNGTEYGPLAAAGIDGSGAANRLAYWTDADTLGAVAAITAGRILYSDANGLPTFETDLQWDGSKLLIGGADNTELFRISATNQILSVKEIDSVDTALLTLGTSGQTHAVIAAPENFYIAIDSNNDQTNRAFVVQKDSADRASGTNLFQIAEDGDISHWSSGRHRMLSQNRFRYLNTMAKVYRTANQTIANNTSTAVQFNNEETDTDALHDNSTDNTRITAALTGKYLVFGTATFSNNSTGRRIMFLRRSGADSLGADARNSCSSTEAELLSTASIATFTAGQYMEMMVIQTSGGDLDMVSFGQSDISMGMVYLGE